jgi:hypothetical protein
MTDSLPEKAKKEFLEFLGDTFERREMTDSEKLAIAIKALEGISKMAYLDLANEYNGSMVYIEDFANETLEQISEPQYCNFCLNRDSIISSDNCCTGCGALKRKTKC